MTGIVLDCSATMGLFFEEERSDYHDVLLDRLKGNLSFVPDIWPLEVGNVFRVSEIRKRLTPAQTLRYLTLLGGLNLEIVNLSRIEVISKILPIARKFSVSYYDSQYLWLAKDMGLPLATLDKKLRAAAEAAGIVVV